MKRLILLLSVLPFLSGCEKEKPVELITFRVEVTRLNFVAPDGLSWDTGGNTPAPDVYAIFRPQGTSGGVQSSITSNVSVVPFFLTGTFSERPSSLRYEILFMDSDQNDFLAGDDDPIGGYFFDLPQDNSRPLEMTLDIPSVRIGAKLHFTYR